MVHQPDFPALSKIPHHLSNVHLLEMLHCYVSDIKHIMNLFAIERFFKNVQKSLKNFEIFSESIEFCLEFRFFPAVPAPGFEVTGGPVGSCPTAIPCRTGRLSILAKDPGQR